MPAPSSYPNSRSSGKQSNQRNRNMGDGNNSKSGKDNDESIDMDISDEMSDDDTFGDDIGTAQIYRILRIYNEILYYR